MKPVTRRRQQITTYAGVFLAGVLGAAAFLGRQSFIVDGIWYGWSDIVWFQAVAQVASDSGPFGITDRLGWPDKYALWSVPQPGLLLLSIFFSLGGLLGLSSSTVLPWSLVVVAGLNGVSTLFFLRSISKSQQLLISSASISVALSLSPFVLLKMNHLSVATFFLIPIFLAVVLRINESQSRKSTLYLTGALALASLAAPMWWTVVAIYLALALGSLNLISRNFRALREMIIILFSLAIGFTGQLILHSTAPSSIASTRGAWDSNIYGGRLVDLFLSSPLFMNFFGVWESIKPGASVELSQVGLVGLLLSAIAICYSLMILFRKGAISDTDKILAGVSLVTLMFFLSGGFGNLQAGLFVLVGSESPARVWARLIIVLAVLGAAMFTHNLSTKHVRNSTHETHGRTHNRRISPWIITSPIVVLTLVVMELVVMRPQAPRPTVKEQFPEWGAVQFLDTNTERDCPVLQLPVESTPGLKVLVAETFPDTLYRGFVPYLLDSSRAWSFGDYDRTEKDAYLEALGTVVSPEALKLAQEAGFCAILFDKTLSQISLSSGGNLPGTQINLGTPAFQSERFDVFLLDPGVEVLLPSIDVSSEKIVFSLAGNGSMFQKAGFHEPEIGHTWGNDSSAVVTFANSSNLPQDLTVYWKSWAHTSSEEKDYPVEIFVNDTPISTVLISGVPDTYQFTIPKELVVFKNVEISFKFLPPTSPCSISDSDDCRNLSVAFQELRFAFE